jgi:hypothetical protein
MSKKFVPNNEDNKCAASKKHDGVSCYTVESLIRMVVAYNVKCHKEKVGTAIVIRENKKYLVKELTNALKDVCSDQLCWMTQDFVKQLNDAEINSNTFRPKITQGRFDWLNTTNIAEVMEQYEHVYKDFKFMGAVPMDFDKLPYLNIRNMNCNQFKKDGIKRLGFIFNLDESWQKGSHWVAMFADIDKSEIYYFDSYGTKPTKQINELVNRIATWCYKHNVANDSGKKSKKTHIDNIVNTINYNKIRHQFKNSECGVYSINFILRLLKGESFNHICENITSDDDVNQCRPVYYRFK